LRDVRGLLRCPFTISEIMPVVSLLDSVARSHMLACAHDAIKVGQRESD